MPSSRRTSAGHCSTHLPDSFTALPLPYLDRSFLPSFFLFFFLTPNLLQTSPRQTGPSFVMAPPTAPGSSHVTLCKSSLAQNVGLSVLMSWTRFFTLAPVPILSPLFLDFAPSPLAPPLFFKCHYSLLNRMGSFLFYKQTSGKHCLSILCVSGSLCLSVSPSFNRE